MVPPVNQEVAREVDKAAKRGSGKDPELAAAQKIIVAIEDLDDEAQYRVLLYIQARVQQKRQASTSAVVVPAEPVALRGKEAIVNPPLVQSAPASFS